MKKTILALIICLASSAYGWTQLGFRGGINLANQAYETTATGFEYSGKIGYLLGVNYEFKFSESIRIRPGIEYALKGTSITINGAEANSNFDYMEIPVDLIYQAGPLHLYTGPYFAFLTSAKSGSLDLKPNYETMDIGLNVGLGFDISKIGVGAKYGFGLSNIL